MVLEPVNQTNGHFIEGVSPDVADQITEAIVATIKQSPSGVVELKALMESVQGRISFHKQINLVWAIMRVKTFLQSKGIIRLTHNTDRTQLISFASSNSISAGQLLTSSSPVRITVAFKLIHEKYSSRENEFINELQKILSTPFIEHFEFIRNNGKLNPYEFVVTCHFRNYAAFDRFLHSKPQREFRSRHWDKEVHEHMHFAYESQEVLAD
ncbi:MAG TPA: hypothetical protein VK589_21885 [Chryseolinea sp.]|nr:hypothetical protein [Chryseolinea sp.]